MPPPPMRPRAAAVRLAQRNRLDRAGTAKSTAAKEIRAGHFADYSAAKEAANAAREAARAGRG